MLKTRRITEKDLLPWSVEDALRISDLWLTPDGEERILQWAEEVGATQNIQLIDAALNLLAVAENNYNKFYK